MKKTGLFYAPAGGSVERVAQKIIDIIASDQLDSFLLTQDSQPQQLLAYDTLLFGISTVGRDRWDSAYGKIGWDFFLPRLNDIDLNQKKVAIFGLGNHILYPNNFVDALGWLGQKVLDRNGNLVGWCDPDNYEFDDSEGLINGRFPGLPLDEDNDNDLTDNRLNAWLRHVRPELLV